MFQDNWFLAFPVDPLGLEIWRRTGCSHLVSLSDVLLEDCVCWRVMVLKIDAETRGLVYPTVMFVDEE
jgi:hypothetical protein